MSDIAQQVAAAQDRREAATADAVLRAIRAQVESTLRLLDVLIEASIAPAPPAEKLAGPPVETMGQPEDG